MNYLTKKLDIFAEWLAKGLGAIMGAYLAYKILVWLGQITPTV